MSLCLDIFFVAVGSRRVADRKSAARRFDHLSDHRDALPTEAYVQKRRHTGVGKTAQDVGLVQKTSGHRPADLQIHSFRR